MKSQASGSRSLMLTVGPPAARDIPRRRLAPGAGKTTRLSSFMWTRSVLLVRVTLRETRSARLPESAASQHVS